MVFTLHDKGKGFLIFNKGLALVSWLLVHLKGGYSLWVKSIRLSPLKVT